MQKKVSIVLPVYNGADNLAESINSILEQSYTNIELIIVDDCSTDRTSEIVNEFALNDSRIKIIRNEKNLKLPRSLNVGFANASGEYFTWTSDDNKYKANAIEKMVHFLDENPQTDMVYADYTNIDAAGNVMQEICLLEPNRLIVGNVIGACFLYTRDIANEVGDYDSSLFLAEDYDYWLRIMKEGKISHLNENLYYYRCHGASLTETKKHLISLQTYKVIEKHFFFMYSSVNTRKEKYIIFNRMLFILKDDVEKQEEVKKRLLKMNPGYGIYVKSDGLKSRISTIKNACLKR